MIILRQRVKVAGQAGRKLVELPRGTALSELDDVQLAQLHAAHFVDVDSGEPGKRTATGDTSWMQQLDDRIVELRGALQFLDDSPGVPSTVHVDPDGRDA